MRKVISQHASRNVFILALLLMYSLGEALASLGPSGGHVPTMAIDLKDPSTIYAGIGQGGVFKSTDGGESWFEVNTGLTNLQIMSLAVAPNDSNTVYVGTGACCPPSEDRVFKSTNGAGDWVSVGINDVFVRSLAMDPKDRNTIYAGTGVLFFDAGLPRILDGGVWKSTDRGGDWSNTGFPNQIAQSLVIDPEDSNTVYAGAFGGGAFKSTNGGGTWESIGLPHRDVRTLALDPKNSSTVYAGTGGNGIYVSYDGGKTWH